MTHPGQSAALRSDARLRREAVRVAFFGGSFDPPHLGHLAVARAAQAAFALDAVLFAPVGMQPLKPEGPAASFEDRLAMTRLAIAGETGFEISLADAPRAKTKNSSRPNYTVDTLESMRAALAPGTVLFCLMGADAFFGLRHWRRAAEIPFLAPLIVASRPGQPLEDMKQALPPGLALQPEAEANGIRTGVDVHAFLVTNAAGDRTPFYVLPSLDFAVSASDIRSAIRAAIQTSPGGALRGRDLVPTAVRDYIVEHHLYRL